jgi:hypothetical protein
MELFSGGGIFEERMLLIELNHYGLSKLAIYNWRKLWICSL